MSALAAIHITASLAVQLLRILAQMFGWPNGTVTPNLIASALIWLPAFLHLHLKLNRHQRQIIAATGVRAFDDLFGKPRPRPPRRKKARSTRQDVKSRLSRLSRQSRRVGRHEANRRLKNAESTMAAPPLGERPELDGPSAS